MLLVFGVFFGVLGLLGFFYVGKNRFNRRNVAGVEEFNSYGHALTSRALEVGIRLGSAISIVLGIVLVVAWSVRS